MRPEILYPLFQKIDSLPGIGKRTVKLVEKLCGEHVVDILFHAPTSLTDRRYQPAIPETDTERVASFTVKALEHVPAASRGRPYTIICADEAGDLIDLIFFSPRKKWLQQQFPLGEMRVISGKVSFYKQRAQMMHPDRVGTLAEKDAIITVDPVYPMTAGLSPKLIRKAILAALQNTPDLPEWQDLSLLKKHGWKGWKTSLEKLHHPEDMMDVDLLSASRQRLSYDELLSNQLALALIRRANKKRGGVSIKGDGHLRDSLLKNLPFALTNAQKESVAEIYSDMESPHSMMRLLQGDVGAGKTIVGLLSMLLAIEAGFQAAMMVPTEILARQHAETLLPLVEKLGLKLTLLTGRDKGKKRKEILAEIEEGKADIIIGTHALFQETVRFNNLGLAIIDEQHRFGVHQRLSLSSKGVKGKNTDVLVMTATPIPRTLTLTAYGDMDVSRLYEKPKGRQPIETRALPQERWMDVANRIKARTKEGVRAYWVCPLVEESELSELTAAEDRAASLRELFGERVGLVHGRMKADEKDNMMQDFAKGNLDILVATTVIEVGVDVPEATIMVIEHAERFGLAQLHQLRGRVGRGADKSACMLLYKAPLTAIARERLDIIRHSEDGFEIAEKDLELRGAGEILGARQSGLPECIIADLAAHSDLLQIARKDAQMIIDADPKLESERGKALKTLLYLFSRDAAVKFLQSG